MEDIRQIKRQIEKVLTASGIRRSKPYKAARNMVESREGYRFREDKLHYVTAVPDDEANAAALDHMFNTLRENGLGKYVFRHADFIRISSDSTHCP